MTTIEATQYERETCWHAAYDRRSDDPHKNYGIHGVSVSFVQHCPQGAVVFQLYTNWHLPHVTKEVDAKAHQRFPHLSCHPQPADIGYHAHERQHDWQEEPSQAHCEFIGGPCYYDGSALSAQSIFAALVAHGDEGLWWALAWWQRMTFFDDADLPAMPVAEAACV